MPSEPSPPGIRAVLFDVDDVLVPFHTVRAFQWAWRPQGPILGDRRTGSALRRSLHAWDRRRWLGVTGKAPPVDGSALLEHLASTLREVAGHAVPAAESDAVVRRLLRPAGEVERYDDVVPALDRLRRAGVTVGALTPLPAESARWLLRRSGLPEELLVGAGEPPASAIPTREAFRAAVERLGVDPDRTAFVGDLFWSDVRAAQRAGLHGLLLDRVGAWPHVQGGRIATLGALDGALAAVRAGVPPVEPPSDDPPSADLL